MYFGLAFAFTIIGLAAGYLVAASDTPVVSAALPILAGLATATIAVVAGRADLDRITSYIRDVTKEAKSRDVATEVNALTRLGRVAEEHTRTTVRALGLLTTLFALGFAAGLGAGTWVRVGGFVNAWAHPLSGPWSVEDEDGERAMVPSFESALYWLGLERDLRKAGVRASTIEALYDQYVVEFTERILAVEPEPSMSAATAAHRSLAPLASTFATPITNGTGPVGDPAIHSALEALLQGATASIADVPRASTLEARLEALRVEVESQLRWPLGTGVPFMLVPPEGFGFDSELLPPTPFVLPPGAEPWTVEPWYVDPRYLDPRYLDQEHFEPRQLAP